MSTAKRLTPNKIANLVMADEAWHDSEYVAASDYDALSAELAALRVERDALRAALNTAMWAMRQPLDEWKGECERKALDKAHAVLGD